MSLWRKLRTALGLPETFRSRHFRKRERWRQDYVKLAAVLLKLVEFDTFLDVGCGNGFLLTEFLRAGKEVRGIEVSPAVHPVLPDELRDRVQVDDFAAATGSWDLVACVEVAEHLPPERSVELVETLTRVARHRIYFTAAPPGQTGHGHINCRPREEWLQLFAQRGWELEPEPTRAVRQRLEEHLTAWWIVTNAVLLRPATSIR